MSMKRHLQSTVQIKRLLGVIVCIFLVPLIINRNTTEFDIGNFSNCDYSKQKSFGFFCETKKDWKIKRAIFEEQETKQISPGTDSFFHTNKGFWWQLNYEPNFSCSFEKRMGLKGDGGKWICDPHRIKEVVQEKQEKCGVLSFGSNNKYEFEESIIAELPMCEIHTFDHTINPANVPPTVNFHKIGINYTNSESAWTLETIMNKLSLKHLTIEILKIDIESWEWDILVGVDGKAGVLFQDDLPFFRQLSIELHPTDIPRTRSFFAQMKALGYVIAHKEPNTMMEGRLQEYLFIKTDF